MRIDRFVWLLLFCLLFCQACVDEDNEEKESLYTPVYMERSELEKSVQYLSTSRDLINPGKIYYKSPYIYVNERYKGIHVINNSNPTDPVREGFILAPGCLDMAIKGDMLYLDNAVDLVTFDLSSRKVINRIPNVFPEPVSPDGPDYVYVKRPEGLIVVSWKRKATNE
jgi:hypothetical protein